MSSQFTQWARRLPAVLGRRDRTVEQRLENVEQRLGHLEAMIEGLQDAVHRQSVRQEREINQLRKGAEPAQIRRALGRDARERGI
jgi:uncharacterized coiled-coil protein SlyX